jgi:hypothetical protein
MYREEQMVVTCETTEVLKTLKKNRGAHAEMVYEAKQGYLKKAKNALETRLLEVKLGKAVPLKFDLSMPEDHTDDYDTAIKMLEMHQSDTIELGTSNIRRFIEDKWDWARGFYLHNSTYSTSTRSKGEENGYL